MKKTCTFLCCALLLCLAGCAGRSGPDAVSTRRAAVIEALGDYAATVYPSVAGNRVYLEGEVPNFNQLQDVLERIRAVPGVNDVQYDAVILSEIGSTGDGDSGWQ